MNSLLVGSTPLRAPPVCSKLAASVLGFALVGCGAPIVPDLVIEVSTTRRRQAPHESRAATNAGAGPYGPSPAEHVGASRARDVSVRFGLALHTAPRRAHVDASPAPPSAHPLPVAPPCRTRELAAWERIAVERAWLLVVLALGGTAESRAAAQPPPPVTSSARSFAAPHAHPGAGAGASAEAELTQRPENVAGAATHTDAEATAGPAPRPNAADATDARESGVIPVPPLEGEALARAIDALFVGEPDVLVVVRDALRVAGLDPSRARRHARRGQRSGLVPDVRLGASRQRGVAATSGQTTNDVTSRTGSDDSLRFEANVAFNLGYLVYGPDAVAWSREERAIVDAAASLAREIVELYFRRRRLIVEIELLGERDPERQLALAEVDAMLEVFTAGNFSRMMRERPPP